MLSSSKHANEWKVLIMDITVINSPTVCLAEPIRLLQMSSRSDNSCKLTGLHKDQRTDLGAKSGPPCPTGLYHRPQAQHWSTSTPSRKRLKVFSDLYYWFYLWIQQFCIVTHVTVNNFKQSQLQVSMCVYILNATYKQHYYEKRELEYFTSSPTKGELAALIM